MVMVNTFSHNMGLLDSATRQRVVHALAQVKIIKSKHLR